jgi:hypothetical protein
MFFRYNLKNAVNIPTRITKSTSTFLDVITINDKNCTEPSIVMDLGLSDHYAQVLSLPFKNFSNVDLK